jgi:hypothetical protein
MLVKIKKYISGILLSKIGTSAASPIYSDDIQQIIARIFEADKTALILPHDKSMVGALQRKHFEMMKEEDYKTFFDINVEQWGHKREDTWKTTMSFYVASDAIEPNLNQLRRETGMENTLKTVSLRMSTHNLHESSDVAIGYFLGKSQRYTWRDELVERVSNHLHRSQLLHQEKCADPNSTVTPIPVAAKQRSIRDSDSHAEVITLFVGTKDAKKVQSLLEQFPFPDVEIVPYSLKRSHPEAWTQRIQIHNIQVNDSRAVKVHRVNESFREELGRNLRRDPDASTMVLDITRLKSTLNNNTVYVQCTAADKEWVKEWVKTQIPVISTKLNLKDGEEPYTEEEEEGYSSSKSTRKGESRIPPNPPAPTRFQHMLSNPRYAQTNQDGVSAPSVPSRKPNRIPMAIITGLRPTTGSTTRSYARATTTIPAESKWQSSSSSPDGSTISSVKTQRERELEEELTATSSQLKETQQKLTEASAQLKATKEAHDKLKSLLEESVNNIQTQLKEQKLEMEESLNRRLAEQWHQFQSQFALQDTNPHTTPNLPRKRQDTRLSPYETHGIPQYYTMPVPQQPLQHYYHQYHQPQMYSPNTHPPYSPGQMEQMEDTEWGKTTHHLQEPSQEDGSAEQI